MTFTIKPRSLLIVAAACVLGVGAAFTHASIPDSNLQRTDDDTPHVTTARVRVICASVS